MVREQLDERLFRTTAPNGLNILTEHLPGLRSAAVGVWVRWASGHEGPEQMGVAHLLEHMVFKGTEKRTAKALAQALEVRGGSLDAYTSRDHTSYQAHVLDQDLPLAVDILTDLVRSPLIRSEDLDLERNVVLEEIKGVEDTPDDLVFDLFAASLWPAHPYGYSILGTPETVGRLTAADIRSFHAAGYYPGNVIVAAAGNVDHDRLLEDLMRLGWFEGSGYQAPRPHVIPTAAVRSVSRRVARDTAQSHIVFGTDTFESRDPRRYAMAVLTNVFGGGMSSRLFQRIREDLGLAYSISAFHQPYRAGGLAGVYVATQPSTASEAKEAIRIECERLAHDGLTSQELAGGKQQLKGQLMLALENPGSRVHRLAGFVLNDDRYRKPDEILAAIDQIENEEINQLAREFFDPARLAVVELGGD